MHGNVFLKLEQAVSGLTMDLFVLNVTRLQKECWSSHVWWHTREQQYAHVYRIWVLQPRRLFLYTSWLCCSMSTIFQSPFPVIVIFIYFFVWFLVTARIVCLIRLKVHLSSLSPLPLLCSTICCSTHPQETSFFILKDFHVTLQHQLTQKTPLYKSQVSFRLHQSWACRFICLHCA